MQKYVALAGFAFLIACDSKTESKAKEKDTTHKSASKDTDLESDMYIDPPAELVAGLGVDAYQGAKVFKHLQGVKGGEGQDAYRDIIFFTHDSPSKVAEFYKTHLPEAKPVGEMLQGMNVYALDGKNSKGNSVRVQAQGYGGLTHIHVVVRKPQ